MGGICHMHGANEKCTRFDLRTSEGGDKLNDVAFMGV